MMLNRSVCDVLQSQSRLIVNSSDAPLSTFYSKKNSDEQCMMEVRQAFLLQMHHLLIEENEI